MNYQRYSNRWNYIGIIGLIMLIFGGFRFVFLLFGLILALVVNFFPLILAGYFVYRFVQRSGKNRWVASSLNRQTDDYRRFIELMVHMMIQVAQADGRVDVKEIQTIRQFFVSNMNFSGGQLTWLNDVIVSAQQSTHDMMTLATEFNHHFEYESQLMLVNMVYNVAYSDGHLNDRESNVIDHLVSILDISSFDHRRIKMAFEAQFGTAFPGGVATWYAVLGLKQGATKDEIKEAYRKLVKTYHPDKMLHLGPTFQQEAEKKMQDINDAYDQLMKRVTL